MKRRPIIRQVDANHHDIAKGLKDRGYSVADVHIVPKFVDLIVAWPGNEIWPWGGNLLVEVKDGDKPPSERQLKRHQALLQQTWRGPRIVALSLEDALSKIERMRYGRPARYDSPST